MSNRSLGMTVIGQTGMGKTAFLHNLILDDIREGRSAIVFDPHGDLTQDILESVPDHLAGNVSVLQVDETMPFGLNLYECADKSSSLAVSRTVDNATLVFKRMMQDERGFHPHIEYLLRNLGHTILANPEYTLAEVGLMFEQTDEGKLFRSHLLQQIGNRDIRAFWQGFEERSKNLAYQYIEPLLNKVSPFITSDAMRLIVAQQKTTIPFSDFLDQSGKTLIISLPIGVLGEEMTQALGMMLLSMLSEHIYERVRQRQERRTPLHLYIDELGRFMTSGTAISKLLKEGRKFNVGTTLAFQTFSDLPDKEAQSAVLQTGTLVFFQVIGGLDAEILTKQLKVANQSTELLPKMRMVPNMKKSQVVIWDDPTIQQLFEEYANKKDERIYEMVTLYNKLDNYRALPLHSIERETAQQQYDAYLKLLDEMHELAMTHSKSVTIEEQNGWLPVKNDDSSLDPRQVIYDMVAEKPRTYADLWNEMQVNLANLPPYTCYIQTINDRHEIIESQQIATPPPVRQPDGKQQAQEIIQRSRDYFGTPAELVRSVADNRIAPFLAKPEAKEPPNASTNASKPKEKIERGKPYKE